jgi:hypothetical protein
MECTENVQLSLLPLFCPITHLSTIFPNGQSSLNARDLSFTLLYPRVEDMVDKLGKRIPWEAVRGLTSSSCNSTRYFINNWILSTVVPGYSVEG